MQIILGGFKVSNEVCSDLGEQGLGWFWCCGKDTFREGKFTAFPVPHSEEKNNYDKVTVINIIKLPHSPQLSGVQ